MEHYLQNMFINVLNMSITASYVILFIILIRQLLKKAPKIFSYGLWAVVLFRLICPLSFSSSLSFFNILGLGDMKHIPQEIGLMQQPRINTGVDSINQVINNSLPAAIPASSANPMQIMTFILSVIWALGVIVLFGYSIISYIFLKRKVRTAMLLNSNVYEYENLQSPFVLGIVKPKIYLPVALNETEKSYILKHENVHISRRDYIIKPLSYMVLCFHWFNPLVWLSFALMSKDMEMSCDEQVLKEVGMDIKKDYSTSLLNQAANRNIFAVSPIAFGESNTKSRIKNVLTYKKPAFWVIIAAVTICIVSGIVFASNPKETIDSDKSWANDIYQYRTKYVGDASKVSGIVYRFHKPESLTSKGIELFTDKLPYGFRVNYKATPEVRKVFSKSENQYFFDQSAIIAFSLIENVEYINFVISDGEQEVVIQRTREWADKLLNMNVWGKSATLEGFMMVRDDIIGKESGNYSSNAENKLQEILVWYTHKKY